MHNFREQFLITLGISQSCSILIFEYLDLSFANLSKATDWVQDKSQQALNFKALKTFLTWAIIFADLLSLNTAARNVLHLMLQIMEAAVKEVTSWRHAYYLKLDHVSRKLYVSWATMGM
ncbi:UDP-N-acetylglucosamine 1-carboxyvinyltransferase [Gossypium arboreum]|uniref:UDP-N-acetylglucosamine 1-carboxyvinyltransferase n=1 Tax=Gossypium arboreum TaxID=29729 RepID=A0A0B0PHW1_GOSAR|nr:UDP-N-acetylglucosamine 1-carboxyvinyltransferase [Gossypium arboreum]